MSFTVQRVVEMPDHLRDGVLYHSAEFGLAVHLCACGCRGEVVTTIGRGGWSLRIKGNRPSLDPSVGNWSLPCRSHYWISDGRVQWAEDWSIQRVLAARTQVREQMARHYQGAEVPASRWSRFLALLRRWLRG